MRSISTFAGNEFGKGFVKPGDGFVSNVFDSSNENSAKVITKFWMSTDDRFPVVSECSKGKMLS
jgi:hypothetical protein